MIKCICGLPGSGKNQYSTNIAVKAMKNGVKVYSSYPIITYIRTYNIKKFFRKVPVTSFQIDKTKFLKSEFEPNSILIFDEAWIDFFNQDWKKVNKEELKKYNGSRHMGITLYYVTQVPDRIIPYLRDVTDSYLWLTRKLLFNRVTEYFSIEHVGKLVGEGFGCISPELVRKSVYFRKKRIMKSYDDSYLKATVIFNTEKDEQYPQFKVKYRNLFMRLYSHLKRKITYRLEL